jgi:hypothetical protein
MSDATTLVRDTVQGGTNGTSPVSFSAGTKDVTNALPVDEILRKDDYYGKSETDTLLNGKLPLAGGTMTGNIAFSGTQTVDGRDVSVDGSKLDGIESGADVTDAGNVGSAIHGATGKSTPVDADEIGLIDSAASNVLKKLTWANLKATLKTYFDTLYQPVATILTAIAALSSTGLIVRTGSGTVAARTITGTANKIAVTNGDGVSGNPTLNVGSSVALLDSAGQSLSGGARVVTYDNGTKSSGTFTPDPGNGPNQKATNNGAHTLAPGTNYGSYYLDYTNGSSAGAITTSGFTKVTGDSFDTTNAHKFKCHITVSEIGSTLNVLAMQ